MFIRSGFNYDTDAVSAENGLLCEDKSLTKQSFKDECDINVLVENYMVNREHPDVRPLQYADFSDVMDFQTAMNAVVDANANFMQLDAKVRARFDNDPQNFLEFCSDPANGDEAVKLGLAELRPSEAPVEPPAQSPT